MCGPRSCADWPSGSACSSLPLVSARRRSRPRCGSSLSRWRGSAMLGALGIIAGIWADKFDQLAAFQNFVVMPVTFLSGVFYSVHGLPPFWQAVSHLNPFFYMIDGFRYGFFAQSDVSPWISLAVVAAALFVTSAVALHLLERGYKLQALIGISTRMEPTPEDVRRYIAAGLVQRAAGRRRRPPFQAPIVSRGVRGQIARGASPARLRGARRPHARGGPCAVDADADAGRVRAQQSTREARDELHRHFHPGFAAPFALGGAALCRWSAAGGRDCEESRHARKHCLAFNERHGRITRPVRISPTGRSSDACNGQADDPRRRPLAGEVGISGAKNAALPICVARC